MASSAKPSVPREVLVLGGGIIGVTTAAWLAKRGFAVTVLEREEGPGHGASRANGGQLSYAFAESFASPHLLANLLTVLAGSDSGLRITPSFDPDFIRWGLRVVRSCSSRAFASNTLEMLKLSLESQLAMSELIGDFAPPFDHSRNGKMLLYRSDGAFRRGLAVARLRRQAGFEQHDLAINEALALEPALRSQSSHLAGIIYSPDDEAGDCYKFIGHLTTELHRRYGVRFLYRTTATGLIVRRSAVAGVRTTTSELAAQSVVVCLGNDARTFLRAAGIAMPVWPMGGYSLTFLAHDRAPYVSITDTERKVVFCRLGSQLRVAGFAELGNESVRLPAARASELAEVARNVFPDAADYQSPIHVWHGFRPMTPTGMPVIGPTTLGGLFLNIGHGMLGWTLAAGSAARISRHVIAP